MNFKKTADTLTKGAHTLERNFYTSSEILNKEYKEHNFDYFESFKPKEHLDQFPVFSKTKNEDNKKISEYPVRTFLHHKEKEPATWLQKGVTHL